MHKDNIRTANREAGSGKGAGGSQEGMRASSVGPEDIKPCRLTGNFALPIILAGNPMSASKPPLPRVSFT